MDEKLRETVAYEYAKQNGMDYVRVGGVALGTLPKECYLFADKVIQAIEPLIRKDEREKVIREYRDTFHWHRGEWCIGAKPLIILETALKATEGK